MSNIQQVRVLTAPGCIELRQSDEPETLNLSAHMDDQDGNWAIVGLGKVQTLALSEALARWARGESLEARS